MATERAFELPPLAQLPADDQAFVTAFVRSHGSIKQMEKLFGVSCPTIKNRLNRIGALLPSVEVEPPSQAPRERGIDLDVGRFDPDRLEAVLREMGELTVDVDQGRKQVRISYE